MTNWIIYVLLYLVITVIFDNTYKKSTKNLKNEGALTVIIELLGALFTLLISLTTNMHFPQDNRVYFLLGIAIVFHAISDRLDTTVRSGLEPSTFSMIKRLSTVFMTIAGFVFLKEPFVLTKFFGAILIIVSNIFIFYKKGKQKFNRYMALGVISNICFAVALFTDAYISEEFNLPLYVAIELGIPAILIMIFEKIKPKYIKEEWKSGNKKMIILSAITWPISIILQLRAYQLGEVSVVAPLCSLTVILNVIIGYCFLKERENMTRKIIVAMAIILGIILISI